jgi:hypothetical protein
VLASARVLRAYGFAGLVLFLRSETDHPLQTTGEVGRSPIHHALPPTSGRKRGKGFGVFEPVSWSPHLPLVAGGCARLAP